MVKLENADRNTIYECNFGHLYTITATQIIFVYICEIFRGWLHFYGGISTHTGALGIDDTFFFLCKKKIADTSRPRGI